MNRIPVLSILLLLLSVGALAQKAQMPVPAGQTLQKTHDVLIKGVYVRYLRQYDPYLKRLTTAPKVKKADDEGVAPSEITSTAYIMRFEPATDQTETDFYGQVFVGNRYYEDQFIKQYQTPNQFSQDRKGSFYLYKLSLLENPQKRWFTITIYSELTTNLCDKKMHENKHRCTTGEQHLAEVIKSAKKIVANVDDQFSIKNEYKAFAIGWEGNVIDHIDLDYTKYAFSTDPFLQTSYTLQHCPDAETQGPQNLIADLGKRFDFREPSPGKDLPPSAMPTSEVATTATNPVAVSRDVTPEAGGGWIYAGIVKKDQKTWSEQVVDVNLLNLQRDSSAVLAKPLLNTYVRDQPPSQKDSKLANGASLGTLAAGTPLTVRSKRYIPYKTTDSSTPDSFLLWLQIEQQPQNPPAPR